MDRISAYHSTTHLNSGSDGLFKISTGTAVLEAESGLGDKIRVVAQAAGVIAGA
jgi:hypothetical protein